MRRLAAYLHPLRCILVFSLVLASAVPASASDDNLLAHRLFEQGDFVRAGEIFTDPAWKGVAFYRSEQWWRAAEAFVRADDPVSAFNLGNCYVQLGYLELALDAYQQALLLDSSLEAAADNAKLMRKLLAAEDKQKQQGGRQPSGEEIERLETQDETHERGSGEGGDEQSDISEAAPTEQSDEQGKQSMKSGEDAQTGQGGQASKQEHQAAEKQDGGALKGESSDESPQNSASGEAESETLSDDSLAAGVRSTLETEQATTQWLNRISHDSALFLQRRIRLEQRRRLAAGQSAPAGGSSW
ncbi:tetratricopeptide repeat protein [Granulosicoccus antarcticus]|uniref:Uncharacterized protein n=1 Tax=Granulosicoccus antarcticus IMCC3135 TaxID=1192854 RepID=A0A2Z2NSF4_9GAMM|nr:tetratricopeptide repeat protein [Granulosicoccus antarcticus]ASJ74253.1 hypothetical protein IMCC3135_20880 [Granulosicoccus antarcticus IMCC3135]